MSDTESPRRWYHGPIGRIEAAAPKVAVVLTAEETAAWLLWAQEARRQAYGEQTNDKPIHAD